MTRRAGSRARSSVIVAAKAIMRPPRAGAAHLRATADSSGGDGAHDDDGRGGDEVPVPCPGLKIARASKCVNATVPSQVTPDDQSNFY